MKKTEPVPSTKATATIGQKRDLVEQDRRREPGQIATARTPSAAIIIRLRFQRSAATPAGRPKHGAREEPGEATTPAFAGECVTASTSSGYAIAVTCVPIDESSRPVTRSTKSRFRRSGGLTAKRG